MDSGLQQRWVPRTRAPTPLLAWIFLSAAQCQGYKTVRGVSAHCTGLTNGSALKEEVAKNHDLGPICWI